MNLISKIMNKLSCLDEDEVFADDLYYIELARQEYINGETTKHSDIKWKE